MVRLKYANRSMFMVEEEPGKNRFKKKLQFGILVGEEGRCGRLNYL